MKRMIAQRATCFFLFGMLALSTVGCGHAEPEDTGEQAALGLDFGDLQEPLRGAETGESGFGEVGVLSGSKGRKLCSGTLILPDAVLTTSECARQGPTSFSTSSRGNRIWPTWRGTTKVLSTSNEAPRQGLRDDQEGLAVVYLERCRATAQRAETAFDLPAEPGQRLWISGFGGTGDSFGSLAPRTRRYAGATVVSTLAGAMTLELDATDLGCDDDRGAGVFLEEGAEKRLLVGVVTGVAANPGGSKQGRGCSRRVTALRLHDQREWLDGMANCSCGRGRLASDERSQEGIVL